MRRLGAVGLLTAIGVSCSSDQVSIRADESDLILGVVHSGAAVVRAWRLEPGSEEVALSEGEELSLYRLAGGDLVQFDGTSPTEQPVVVLDAALADCPCVAPESRPWIVSPGETCPLPTFTEVLSGRADLVSRIFLRWPGVCACSVRDRQILGTATPDVETFGREWPPFGAAVGDRGDVYEMNHERIQRKAPEAEVIVQRPGAIATSYDHGPLVRFDSGLAWLQHQQGSGTADQVVRVRLDSGEDVSHSELGFRAVDMVLYPGGVLISGYDASTTAHLVACTIPDLRGCKELLTTEMQTGLRELRFVKRTSTGAIVALGVPGGIVFEGLPPASEIREIEVTEDSGEESGAVGLVHANDGTSTRWRLLRRIAIAGQDGPRDWEMTEDALYTCIGVVPIVDNRPRTALGAYPASGFFDHPDPVEFTSTVTEGAGCFFFRGADARVRALTGVGRYVCTRDGCAYESDDDTDPGNLGGLAWEPEGPISQVVNGTLVPVAGHPRQIDPLRVMVRLNQGQMWLMSRSGQAWMTDGSTLARSRSFEPPGWVLAGAWNSATGRVVLTGIDDPTSCRSWMGELDLESLEWEPQSAAAVDQEEGCDPLEEIREGAPGRFVGISRLRSFFLHAGRIELLELPNDDPTTSTTEIEPETCFGRGKLSAVRGPSKWSDLAGGIGSVLVTACTSGFYRVNVLADPPRAERIGFEALRTDLGDPSAISLPAVGGTCGNLATLAGPASGRVNAEVGHAVLLSPGSYRRSEAGFLEPRLRLTDINLSARSSTWLAAGRVVDVVGEPPAIVFGGSAHYLGSTRRTRWSGFRRLVAAAELDKGVIFSTESGRVLFLPYPP